jgi:hypothetical protein
MNKKDKKLLLGFLRSIENGQRVPTKILPMPCRFDYLSLHYGNVDFHVSDGWVMTVFFDCGEFDYIDSIRTPEGKRFDYDDFSEAIRNYRPPKNIRMVMYGEPGYGGENIKQANDAAEIAKESGNE